MVSKMFEIRDRGTAIPVLAIQLGSDNDQETWLLWRAGYCSNKDEQKRYVILVDVLGGCRKANSDPFDWGPNDRTRFNAHRYIEKHFDDLEPGAVVDVEYVLGEVPMPKVTERRHGEPW